MQRIESPQALPGSCLVCGSGDRRSYVDLDFSFEGYGAVIVCDVCISMMAQVLGLPNVPEYVSLKERNAELEKRLFEAVRWTEGLVKIVEGVDWLGLRGSLSRGSAGGDDSTPPVATEADEGGAPPSAGPVDEPPSGGASNGGDGAGNAPEPGDDLDMAGLRPSDQLPEFAFSLGD